MFRTPRTGLEIGMGPDLPDADIMVEVADADTAAAALGKAGFKPDELADNVFPLLDTIRDYIPHPPGEDGQPLLYFSGK